MSEPKSLHGQLLGAHALIACLEPPKGLMFLISYGIISQSLGHKYNAALCLLQTLYLEVQ